MGIDKERIGFVGMAEHQGAGCLQFVMLECFRGKHLLALRVGIVIAGVRHDQRGGWAAGGGDEVVLPVFIQPVAVMLL